MFDMSRRRHNPQHDPSEDANQDRGYRDGDGEHVNAFIRLSCPACGGHLEITSNINQFVCAHCGVEHIVNRGDGFVSLQPLVHGLSQIRAGTDRTADELAVQRMRLEVPELNTRRSELEQVLKMNDLKRSEVMNTRAEVILKLIGVSLAVVFLLFSFVARPFSANVIFMACGSPLGVIILFAAIAYGYSLYSSYLDWNSRLTILKQGQTQLLNQISEIEKSIARTQDRIQQTVTRLQAD